MCFATCGTPEQYTCRGFTLKRDNLTLSYMFFILSHNGHLIRKLRNDRFLEVLEEIEVRCEAPNISKCTQLLCSAFSQCMSLEAKCVLLEKAE